MGLLRLATTRLAMAVVWPGCVVLAVAVSVLAMVHGLPPVPAVTASAVSALAAILWARRALSPTGKAIR